MTPVGTTMYLEIQRATQFKNVTLPLKRVQPLARAHVMACISALYTRALAYFLQAVLNRATEFQTLQHPLRTLQDATNTVRRGWTLQGHRPTSHICQKQYAKRRCHTMGTTPTTWCTTRTLHTQQPSCPG